MQTKKVYMVMVFNLFVMANLGGCELQDTEVSHKWLTWLFSALKLIFLQLNEVPLGTQRSEIEGQDLMEETVESIVQEEGKIYRF